MPVFAYSIAADPDKPSLVEGFIRAETIAEAVKQHGDADVNVYPLPVDTEWPGPPDEAVWACR